MKTTIEMNGLDSKELTFQEFESLINQVGMNWYGLDNWTRGDLDLFEEKFDGFTCEPIDGKMKIWDRNFDYSPLYN
jgi:hypothetical protein